MNELQSRRGLPPALTAALVVGLFVIPIGIAWWFALVNPPSEGIGLVNRGQLVRPPVDIRNGDEFAPLRTIALGPGEWAMVYFGAGSCATSCRRDLDMLKTIYDVLGHDSTRVRIVALLDAPADVAGVTLLSAEPSRRQLSAALGAGGISPPPERGVVFLDWRGQIMLWFADASEPADIKKDLKRLLRGSKIN